ncbi:MAG: hypothetical protein JNM70_15640 [Anaerolineae bacterium]|nr:hypothetical protein [Anaerolineae bacterium]
MAHPALHQQVVGAIPGGGIRPVVGQVAVAVVGIFRTADLVGGDAA